MLAMKLSASHLQLRRMSGHLYISDRDLLIDNCGGCTMSDDEEEEEERTITNTPDTWLFWSHSPPFTRESHKLARDNFAIPPNPSSAEDK